MPGFGKSGICLMCALRSMQPPPSCDRGVDRTAPWGRQAVAAVLLALGSAGLLPPEAAAFGQGRLTIESASGASHAFEVELALTPADRERGLMFRESMAPDKGMLFDFGRPQPIQMWMKDTKLPLDMVFIGADGRVKGVAADTVPYSEAIIASPGPVRAVLELNAGTAKGLGIGAGDRVVSDALPPVK